MEEVGLGVEEVGLGVEEVGKMGNTRVSWMRAREGYWEYLDDVIEAAAKPRARQAWFIALNMPILFLDVMYREIEERLGGIKKSKKRYE